jgi:hypothetical protein
MNQISFIITGQTGNHELLCDNADVMVSIKTRRLLQIEEILVRKEAVSYWIK